MGEIWISFKVPTTRQRHFVVHIFTADRLESKMDMPNLDDISNFTLLLLSKQVVPDNFLYQVTTHIFFGGKCQPYCNSTWAKGYQSRAETREGVLDV